LIIDKSLAGYRNNRMFRSAVLLVSLSGKTHIKEAIYSVW